MINRYIFSSYKPFGQRPTPSLPFSLCNAMPAEGHQQEGCAVPVTSSVTVILPTDIIKLIGENPLPVSAGGGTCGNDRSIKPLCCIDEAEEDAAIKGLPIFSPIDIVDPACSTYTMRLNWDSKPELSSIVRHRS